MNLILFSLQFLSVLQVVLTFRLTIPKITNINQLAENTERITKRANNNRIINGVAVDISQYSSAASIYIDATGYGTSCTGTFISKDVVLTAAHCVYNQTAGLALAQNVFVSGGTQSNVAKSSNVYKTKNLLIHPSYSLSDHSNDIALIFLQNPPSNPPYTFAKIYDVPITDDTPVEVAGWGVTSNSPSATISDVLMAVPLQISSSQTCNDLYSLWKSNSGNTICTMNQNGQDSCRGDSGGPLYFTGDSSKPVAGITSFGGYPKNSSNLDCGVNGYTVYYTNVQNYIDWISSNTQINTSDLVFKSSSTSSSNLTSTQESQSKSESQATPGTQSTSTSEFVSDSQSPSISQSTSERAQPKSENQSASNTQPTSKGESSTTNTSSSATLSINIYTAVCTIFLLYCFIA
ncbi:hypothetical protein BB558_001088 [Smittium angustum]|uniref:Peptidase S1 domain-containing protein n=1 Tax=Smittium angustum TaxID=133377 RepID=A0A2U1JCR5_SMIAN|nr:hypothetical protein BB558_001088 [Smittium angustum]